MENGIGSRLFRTIITVAVSAVFIVVGLVFFTSYDPSVYDVKATGTITDMDEHYESIGGDNELVCDVYIDYVADGKNYEHVEFGEWNSGMRLGDEVEFWYMSSDPAKIASAGKDAAPYFALAFAIVGFVILAVTIIRGIRSMTRE